MSGFAHSASGKSGTPDTSGSPLERAQSERVRARIRVEGETPLETDTIDLSHGGLSITSRQPLNLGQECSIELGINVPELAAPPVLRAAVHYCVWLGEGEYRIGLKFVFVSIEAAELIAAALS